jgi:two-component system phosphate regulon sensor histidine kinase PhoR
LPSARHLDTPTLVDHVPRFVTELAAQLRSGSNETIAESIEESQGAADHGVQRADDGFDIVELVAEYNILRECIHDLAARNGVIIQGDMFRVINRLLDSAIGSAVQNYATAQALEVQRRREEHLSFIAHDLRTPLNAIAMSAKLLEQAGDGTTIDRPVLQKTLSRNIDQLAGLVDDVLKENSNVVTEIGVRLERRWFDLWPFVERMIYELRPIAATGSTALINRVPPDLRIYADASLMVRLFQNLLSNAIRHTPNGQVRIGAQESLEGAKVEIWVADNGVGIPAEKLHSVFDKFETERVGEHGAGLGLAIVKTFVEAHGGVVDVESEVNAGTTFRVTLPLGTAK